MRGDLRAYSSGDAATKSSLRVFGRTIYLVERARSKSGKFFIRRTGHIANEEYGLCARDHRATLCQSNSLIVRSLISVSRMECVTSQRDGPSLDLIVSSMQPRLRLQSKLSRSGPVRSSPFIFTPETQTIHQSPYRCNAARFSTPLPFKFHQPSAIEVQGSTCLGLLHISIPSRAIIRMAALELDVPEYFSRSKVCHIKRLKINSVRIVASTGQPSLLHAVSVLKD